MDTPPVRSNSERTREDRSSGRVFPPGRENRRHPSGLSTL